MNRTLRSLVKTAVYGMDDFFDRVDRASDLLSDFSDRGRKLIYRQEGYAARTLGAFAAGLGVGLGVGMLFAPASGKQTRDSLSGKIQDIGSKVGERLGAEKTRNQTRPTGTGAM